MKESIDITLTTPRDLELLERVFDHVQRHVAIYKVEDLREAFDEIIANVITHAYPKRHEIYLHVSFTIMKEYIRVNIDERGLPFDFSRYLAERIDGTNDHSKGFLRVYDLVELFYYGKLEDHTKRFSLIQPLERFHSTADASHHTLDINKEELRSHLDIRVFKEGDGEGIAQLVYHNYDYTYYKSLYYDPKEIREANRENRLISIVARYHNSIIGHFALIPSQHSNIAEIAVAVVDPKFKRMGIMSAMFDVIITEAKIRGFHAIYGEGMMMHPYSQRANLSHAMVESAILLGEVPAVMEIEHTIKDANRSGVLFAFLLFEHQSRSVHLPKRYESIISQTYKQASLVLHVKLLTKPKREPITKRSNVSLNVGGIIIEDEVEERILQGFLDELLCEKFDMITADINLHHISAIDTLVEMLNRQRFFYCGVLFQYYHNEDYLRLQRINSRFVDTEELVCYSENAKKMLSFVLKDRAHVNSAIY